MSKDIVDELRHHGSDMACDAADEIERLRAALQAIVDDDMDDTAVAIAAKALGLKVFVGNSPNEDIKRAAGGE